MAAPSSSRNPALDVTDPSEPSLIEAERVVLQQEAGTSQDYQEASQGGGDKEHEEEEYEAEEGDDEEEEEEEPAKAGSKRRVRRKAEPHGAWLRCAIYEADLKGIEAEGCIPPREESQWRVVHDQPKPEPQGGERMLTVAAAERGVMLPPSKIFKEVLEHYHV